MKLVFIASPFRAPTEWGRVENVRLAERLALEVWKAGAVAICPQANSAHFQDECPDRVFLDGYLELLRRCDAVLFTDESNISAGVGAEIEEARHIGLPIFSYVEQVARWVKESAS